MNNIKDIREAQGLSQAELARRIGVTPATVSRLESGARKLSQDYLQMIARTLNCDPGDLIGKQAGVGKDLLLPVVGTLDSEAWRVPAPKEDIPSDTVPVILPTRLGKLNGSAWRVANNHMPEVCPAGGYVITVPVESLRKQPLTGDVLVIRSKEGKLERSMLATAMVDSRGVMVNLGGEDVEVSGDNWHVGLVVAVYREL